jgi:hypothetical protein
MGMIPFIRPQKAKQTNRVKDGGVTRLLSASETIAWAETLCTEKYWAEIKHNGFRAQFQRDGWWTTNPSWVDRTDGFEHICRSIPEGMVLDGELVPNDGEGHEVVAHYRSACPEKLKFVAFDILQHKGMSTLAMPQWRRRDLLVEYLMEAKFAVNPDIVAAQIFTADFGKVLKDALAQGREGLIFKNTDSKYTPGSRSAWLKCKATETVDVVITDADSKPTEWRVKPGELGKDGVLYPEGRHSDPWLAGHVGLSYGFHDARTGKLVRVGSLGITGLHKDMVKHIGRVAEVASFGPQFPTGAIQHPTFLHWRDDKNATDCAFDFANGSAPEVVSKHEAASFDMLSVFD